MKKQRTQIFMVVDDRTGPFLFVFPGSYYVESGFDKTGEVLEKMIRKSDVERVTKYMVEPMMGDKMIKNKDEGDVIWRLCDELAPQDELGVDVTFPYY